MLLNSIDFLIFFPIVTVVCLFFVSLVLVEIRFYLYYFSSASNSIYIEFRKSLGIDTSEDPAYINIIFHY